MRHRLPGAILFALALLTQVLMPASMARASGLAGDPLGHAIICGQDGFTATDDAGTPALPSPDGHDHCPMCQPSAGGGLAIEASQTFLVIPHALIRSIAWPPLAIGEIAVPRGPHAPPRGPPSLV